MKFEYGIADFKVDITDIIINKYCNNNLINFNGDDFVRGKIFGDCLPGIKKSIFFTDNWGNIKKYKSDEDIINLNLDHQVEIEDKLSSHDLYIKNNIDNIKDPAIKLSEIHKILEIEGGTFEDEYPEQLMVASFLTGDEKVLEIGSNIGRNSLIIATILNDSKNLVTLECDKFPFYVLCNNKEINNLNFNCVNAALSKRKLIQKGWDTIPSEEVLEGYKEINTISYEELKNKFNMNFDTLVLDCEGAFYYILVDEPNILKNVNLIFMENDYHYPEHKKYIDNAFINEGFRNIYKSGNGFNYMGNFYEVWSK